VKDELTVEEAVAIAGIPASTGYPLAIIEAVKVLGARVVAYERDAEERTRVRAICTCPPGEYDPPCPAHGVVGIGVCPR
jgi:hypothetical protein